MGASEPGDATYASRLDEERRHYDSVVEFDDLPPIYHYWSHTYIRPMLEPLGSSRPAELFARYLREGAERSANERPAFASIGSGDANNELEIARLLKAAGLCDFTIDCIEFNPALIERSVAAANDAGLAEHLAFVEQDFNNWKPSRTYHGIVANQSLHHVSNLEGLLDAVRVALAPGAYFVTSDIVGRNGHQRWPEARHLVERFWRELPASYRHHRQLDRYEEWFEDWDCSSEGFEGIRSQDILKLLVERFYFHVFIGFGNVIDPFVDRGFGPNFNADARWDRGFIDRVHACDERALLQGFLTPTHVMAVMSNDVCGSPYYARGLTPEASVRRPGKSVDPNEVEAADRALDEYFSVSEQRLPIRGSVRQIGGAVGWYEDDWVGEALEFSVVAESTIARLTLDVAMAPGLPPEAALLVELNGAAVPCVRSSDGVAVECAVRLGAGERATVRVAATATVNPKERGESEDARNLGFHLRGLVFGA